MSANKLNTTTFNTVSANTVADAVIDAPSILGWRQNVQVVVDQHADQINAIQGALQNALINPNFAVNQLVKSGTVTLTAGAYGHDMWKAGASGCTYTFATSNNVTTITITAGSLIQVIEGINLFSGTYTLSWTGTAQGKIGAGSYGASGITGTVVGGTNLNIEFNTGTLSKVQFNAGDTALPFQPRIFAEEERLCRKHYQEYATNGSTQVDFSTGVFYSTSQLYAAFSFDKMRVTPTCTITNPTGFTALIPGQNIAALTLTAVAGSSTGLEFILTASGTPFTAGQAGLIRILSPQVAKIALDARL